MDNQDTLFNQIKSAAQNAESKEFPAMDKVWNRVEEKLDHKVLTKQNTLWKKIAVAASILLVISIVYQFFKDDKEIVIPENTTAIIDTTKVLTDSITKENNLVVVETNPNPKIKANADQILEKQTTGTSTVVSAELLEKPLSEEIRKDDESILQAPAVNNSTYNSASTNGTWMADSNFKARGVTYKEVEAENKKDKAEKKVQNASKKEEPLVVIDDKHHNLDDLKEMNNNELESIMVLPDPLYIINGVYYTEKEVFGPNPTSPYSPLNKQEIETISILQDEKAVSIYGEKGKKGVVIITTKGGKPAPKKKE